MHGFLSIQISRSIMVEVDASGDVAMSWWTRIELAVLCETK